MYDCYMQKHSLSSYSAQVVGKPEFADTNSFGDKLSIFYFCHKENASYER